MTDDNKLENVIGTFLRVGVLSALVIVLIGGTVYVAKHHSETESYSRFEGARLDLRSISTVWQAAMRFQSLAVIQLGLIVLIATPVVRVMMAAVGFALERDRLYVLVSCVLLTILLYSILTAA